MISKEDRKAQNKQAAKSFRDRKKQYYQILEEKNVIYENRINEL